MQIERHASRRIRYNEEDFEIEVKSVCIKVFKDRETNVTWNVTCPQWYILFMQILQNKKKHVLHQLPPPSVALHDQGCRHRSYQFSRIRWRSTVDGIVHQNAEFEIYPLWNCQPTYLWVGQKSRFQCKWVTIFQLRDVTFETKDESLSIIISKVLRFKFEIQTIESKKLIIER